MAISSIDIIDRAVSLDPGVETSDEKKCLQWERNFLEC